MKITRVTHIPTAPTASAQSATRASRAVDMAVGGQLVENASTSLAFNIDTPAFPTTCPPTLDNSLNLGCDISNELDHVTFLTSLDILRWLIHHAPGL